MRSDAAAPLAVVLVRNGVTHDARVLREAAALRDSGLRPLIVGVTTTQERETRDVVGGFDVVRVDPLATFTAPLRWLKRGRPAPVAGAPVAASAAPVTPGPGRSEGAKARVRRALVSLEFTRRALTLVLRERPVLVHANDFNTMWVGVLARLLTGARLIYDSHELWPDRNGRPEWRPGLIAAEALFVRIADRVVTTSPGYADVIRTRYRVAAPLLVRNIPPLPAQPVPAGRGEADPPVAVYVGGLLRGRGLEQSIDALALVPELRLRLVGPGVAAYRAQLAARARQAGVSDRVTFVEPVEPGAVVATLAGATMGLGLIQPVCRSYELTLPNKLFEYAAAGLPMVVSDLPVMAALVREWDCGVLVAPDAIAAIAAAMRDVLDPDRRAHLAAGARWLGRTVTWAAERARLTDLYRELAS